MKKSAHLVRFGIVVIAVLSLCFLVSCASSDPSKTDVVSAPSMYHRAESDIRTEIQPITSAGKVLVVYYSQGTAGRQVAEDIAVLTGADLEEIKEVHERKTGFFGFMLTGAASTFKFSSKIEPPQRDPAQYDTVYVITPIWSWSLSPPVRSWLKLSAGKIRRAAFITISGDTKPDKVVKDMEKTGKVAPFAFVGYAERDFLPENRTVYVEKLKSVLNGLPGNKP